MTTFLDTWNANYESLPEPTEDISLGAGRITDLKVNVRQRLQVNHSLNGDANDGLHTVVELMPQVAPGLVNASDGAFYAQTINGQAELVYNNGQVTQQMTSGGNLIGGSAGNTVTIGNIGGECTAQFGGSSSECLVQGTPGSQMLVYYNSNCYLRVAPGNTGLVAASGTYMVFNATDNAWEFYVNSTLVGHFP